MLSVPPLIPAVEGRGDVPEYAGRAVVRQRSNFLSQMISLNKKRKFIIYFKCSQVFCGTFPYQICMEVHLLDELFRAENKGGGFPVYLLFRMAADGRF